MKKQTLAFLFAFTLLLGLTVCHAQIKPEPVSYLKTFSKDGTTLKILEPNIADSVISTKSTVDFYQFNVTLEKPPISNIFKFPLETEGLTFLYQPPLTEELDIKQYDFLNATDAIGKTEVIHRPENVVGSYAVYKQNVKSGETGKLYHIYTPLIIDAKGSQVWGKLNVTETALTVTVPKDFLEKAVYPIIIDPSFGYTTIGGTSAAGYSGEYAVKTLFTTPEAGTLNTVTVYSVGSNGIYIDLGMYSSTSLLTREKTLKDASSGWFTADVADYGFLGSTEYGLAFKTIGATALNFNYDSGSANQCQRNFGLNVADNLPSTFTVSDQVPRLWSIYANYTASAVTPENVSVVLNTPANESIVTSYTQDFVYTPTLIGTDNFSNASLYLNGTLTTSNTTAIANATANTITYVLPGANATYLWDIQVWNSTNAVFSSNGNFTLTVAVSAGTGDTSELEAEWIALGLIACVVVGSVAVLLVKQRHNGK